MFGPPVPMPGEAAPLFALPDQDDRPWDLRAARGERRVLLVFYPEDEGPVTRRFFQALQAAVPALLRRRTVLAAVSHNSVRSHARFAKQLNLGFPLLSDPAGVAAKPYGAWRRLPFYKRRAIIVDGRGLVRFVCDGIPEVEALLTFIDGLQGDLR